MLNNRPITKLSQDPNDLDALTPNHRLLLKGKPILPPGLFDKKIKPMREEDGNYVNTSLFSFRNAGFANTYPCYRNAKNGNRRKEALFLET